jgi:[ribosomal protein S5]-alanine N-acetyltransferase
VIETERLLIRPFTAHDAEALLAIWGDPANERFIGATPPRSVEQTREWIGRGMPWGVWERDTGELVGDCGLFRNDGEWELAYGFRRDRWGSGYATEAGAACIRYGFEQLGLDRIVADVPRGHAPSIGVLEKLGFSVFREEPGRLFYEVTGGVGG